MKNSVGASIKYVAGTPQRKKMFDMTLDDVNFGLEMSMTKSPVEYQQTTLKYAIPFIENCVRNNQIRSEKYSYFPLVMGRSKFIASVNLVGEGNFEDPVDFLKEKEEYKTLTDDCKESINNSLIIIDGKIYSAYVTPDKRRMTKKKKRK